MRKKIRQKNLDMNANDFLRGFSEIHTMNQDCQTKHTQKELLDLGQTNWAWIVGNLVAKSIANVVPKLTVTTKKGQAKSEAAVKNLDSMLVKQFKDYHIDKVFNLENVEEVIDHKFLDILMKPNEFQTRFEFIVETQLDLDFCGNAYWMIARNMLGGASALYIISPDKIKHITDKDTGKLLGYEIDKNSVALEDIIHFRNPDPGSTYSGQGSVECVASTIENYNSMNRLELSLNRNNAKPDIVILYKPGAADGSNGLSPQLSAEELENLEKSWNKKLRGINNTGKAKVLDGAFDVKELGRTPREMQYAAGRQWSKNEIASAFNVPLALLGGSDINRATLEASMEQFEKFCLNPRLTLIEETLNLNFSKLFDEDRLHILYPRFIHEDFEQSMKLKDFEMQKIQFMLEKGLITNDEAKQKIEEL